MKQHEDTTNPLKVLDRRDVRVILNAVLFITNFMLIYFLWLKVFPGMTGITRLIACWIGAYAFTWSMTLVTKGVGRLVLAIIFLGTLYMVFHFNP
jgi:hypothetical protein